MTSTFLWNISLWVQPTTTLNRLLFSPYHQNIASQPQLHRNKSLSSRKIQAIKERQSPLQKSAHTPTPKLIRKVWPCSRNKCCSHFPNALSVWNHYTQTLIHILKNILKDFHTTSALLAKYYVLACCKTLKVCLCFHDLKKPNQATTISKNNVQKTCPLNGILQLKLKSRKANKASITSDYVIWSRLSEDKYWTLNTNEILLYMCRIAHQRLHSPVPLKLKSVKAEQMGDDSGEIPVRHKRPGFFRCSTSRSQINRID